MYKFNKVIFTIQTLLNLTKGLKNKPIFKGAAEALTSLISYLPKLFLLKIKIQIV
ncbi:hypothetical protein P20495_3704 [Pseudoalteromonas sp. BSi20495]|nr:hypothetical protein P20495_3704 [Pseudoalteromonas sp. BSi20495]